MGVGEGLREGLGKGVGVEGRAEAILGAIDGFEVGGNSASSFGSTNVVVLSAILACFGSRL